MKESLMSRPQITVDNLMERGRSQIIEGKRKLMTASEGLAPGAVQVLAGAMMCTLGYFRMFLDYQFNGLEKIEQN